MTDLKYFNNVAGEWDTMRESFFNVNVRKKALKIANINSGQITADIGAGTGFITDGLLEKGVQVIAVDQSEAMLEVLKSKFGAENKIDCRIGESENLPVDDNSVDFVFANMYLHHVENPLIAIKEMTRILKPGGKLIITDLDKHNFKFLVTEQNDRWMGFDRNDLEQWFLAAGLKNVNITCAEENCCAKSETGNENAQISIFIAAGEK